MVLPKDIMMESEALLAGTFFSYTFGETMGGKVFPVFIALSAFGAVCAMVYSAARVIFAAAESGYFPFSSVFASNHATFKTPVNALLFHWVCVVVYMVAPPPGAAFEFLVQFAQYPTWIFYGLAIYGLIRMRKSHPHYPRSFRVWLPLSVIFILVAVFLAIFPFVPSENPDYPYFLPPLFGVLFLLIGIPLWHVLVNKSQPEDTHETGSVLKEFIDIDHLQNNPFDIQ
jgi:amino acid transporter